MEQEANDIKIEINDVKVKVKHEIIDSVETLLEGGIVKQEKDIPEYVNVNTFSNVKVETEAHGAQETFQCSQCPNKYKKIAYLTIHKALHDPQRYCPICYETYTCKKKLGQHLNQHIKDQIKEDKKLAFSCNYCEKSFSSKKKFTLHVRVHTNERPHKCEICGEGFKQTGTLKDHYVTHTKEKRFVCEMCNGSFTTSSSLKRHKRKMHDKGKTINCKHCDAKFLNMADFRTHRNNVHPDVGYRRTCPLCLETFRTRNNFKKHKQYHDDYNHQLPKRKKVFSVFKYYLCILCGQKISTLSLYLKHRRIHLNYTEEDLEEAKKNKVFKCKSCTEQFLAKSTLFKHMDLHMEKTLKCDLCQNVYTYHGLNTHMRVFHQMLHCRVCRKVISGRAKLYYHYQKCHPTVKKPYPCSICGKQYMARNQLNLHFKLVHEANSVKNFKCNDCGKRFLTKLIMGSHMAHVHNRKIKHKCSSCDFVCTTKKELRTHNSIHKESSVKAQKFSGEKPSNSALHKRFQCKLCKKKFRSSKSYRRHLTFKICRSFIEKGKLKEAANNNRCVECSREFITAEMLRRHMNLHSTFDFTCRFCDKKYKMVWTMKRHIQVHHPGERVFMCESCGEGFDTLRQYRKHKNEHKMELEVEQEPPVHINSYADEGLDLERNNIFGANEFDVIKREPEDSSLRNSNQE